MPRASLGVICYPATVTRALTIWGEVSIIKLFCLGRLFKISKLKSLEANSVHSQYFQTQAVFR